MQVLCIAAPTATGDGRHGRAGCVATLAARAHEVPSDANAARGIVDATLRGS